MFEIINGGLFVAFVIGITTLAIKYPKTYKGIQTLLVGLIAAGIILYFVYSMGFIFGTTELYKLIDTNKFKEADEIIEKAKPDFVKTLLFALGSIAYLTFLTVLSGSIADETNQSPEQKMDVEQNADGKNLNE